MNVVLSKFVLEAPATKEMVKEMLWKPLMTALTGHTSTKQLLKKAEIDQIWDSLNKFYAQTWQVSIPPFPSYENTNEYLKSLE